MTGFPTWVLESLWRASWQSAVLAVVVLAIIRAMSRWITPHWQVVLLTLPLLRMACFVLPTSMFSLYELMQLEAAHTAPLAFPAREANDINIDFVLDSRSIIDAKAEWTSPQLPLAGSDIVPLPSQSSHWNWQTGIVAVWLAGFLASFYCWSLRLMKIHRLRTRLAEATGVYADTFRNRCRELRLRRPVRLLVSDDRIGPATLGLFAPVVLIPARLLIRLPENSVRLIIEHELQHIRRWDSCWLLLAQSVRCVQWFNPFSYLVSHRLRQAIELATDAATLGSLGRSMRRDYGELIIDLSNNREDRQAWAQIASHRSFLKTRIGAMVNPTPRTPSRTVLSLGLIAGLSLTMLSDAQTHDAPTQDIQPQADQSLESLVGIVVNEQDEPVAHAVVAVETGENTEKEFVSTNTDRNGEFKLAYDARAAKPRVLWVCSPQKAVAAVAMGQRKVHRIVIPSPSTVEYQVRSADALPLKNAMLHPNSIHMNPPNGWVETVPQPLRRLLAAEGDRQGRFLLTGWAPEVLHFVSVRTDGFGEQVFQAHNTKLQLRPVGNVAVRLHGLDGKLVEGPKVVAVSVPTSEPFDVFAPPSRCFSECQLGADGVYRASVATGRVAMRVFVTNSDIAQPLPTQPVQLTAGQSLNIDVNFQATVAIRGVAVGADGQPMPGVLLRVEPVNGESVTVRTDNQGAFSCRVLPGEIRVESAEVPRKVLRQYSEAPLMNINTAKDTDVRLVFPLQQPITGRIERASGTPAGHQQYYVSGFLDAGFSAQLVEGVVDDQGNFEAVPLFMEARQMLRRGRYFLSDKPIVEGAPASSQPAVVELKLQGTFPLVLQLDE